MANAAAAATIHQGLTFRAGPFGTGGFAAAPIPPGTELASLPYAAVLSEPAAAARPPSPYCAPPARWRPRAAPSFTS